MTMRELTEGEVAAMRAYRSDAELGRRVRELLASEEPPESLKDAPGQPQWVQREMVAGRALAWLREQLLNPAPGSLATGGATGEDDGR